MPEHQVSTQNCTLAHSGGTSSCRGDSRSPLARRTPFSCFEESGQLVNVSPISGATRPDANGRELAVMHGNGGRRTFLRVHSGGQGRSPHLSRGIGDISTATGRARNTSGHTPGKMDGAGSSGLARCRLTRTFGHVTASLDATSPLRAFGRSLLRSDLRFETVSVILSCHPCVNCFVVDFR